MREKKMGKKMRGKKMGKKMRDIQDYYFKEAKRLGYSARSVFKLKEIAEKFGLRRVGGEILDLGAYPGSWGEYMEREWGIGEVVAVDMKVPVGWESSGVRWVKKDILELEFRDFGRRFDLVLSDAAPMTRGGDLDHQVSLELCRKVLEVASWGLKGKGDCVCKVLGGEDLKGFVEEARVYFKKLKLYKPKELSFGESGVVYYWAGVSGGRGREWVRGWGKI